MREELNKKFDAKVFYNLSNAAPEKIDEKIKKQAQNFALDKNEFFTNRPIKENNTNFNSYYNNKLFFHF